jgi:hypothetical protein|eukprot:2069787-Prymnesium_polylepis.1
MKNGRLFMLALTSLVAASAASPLQTTVRRQHMSAVGRQEWVVNNTVAHWLPSETAVVVVDMWDKHWCASATTRVAELATPMNEYVKAARMAGMTIVWAPSDVTAFYEGTAPRNNTLSLPEAPLPPATPVKAPPLPLGTTTDGGCDTPCEQRSAWSRQIATLTLEPTDFLIASAVPAGTQELWNVLSKRGIRNVVCAPRPLPEPTRLSESPRPTTARTRAQMWASTRTCASWGGRLPSRSSAPSAGTSSAVH